MSAAWNPGSSASRRCAAREEEVVPVAFQQVARLGGEHLQLGEAGVVGGAHARPRDAADVHVRALIEADQRHPVPVDPPVPDPLQAGGDRRQHGIQGLRPHVRLEIRRPTPVEVHQVMIGPRLVLAFLVADRQAAVFVPRVQPVGMKVRQARRHEHRDPAIMVEERRPLPVDGPAVQHAVGRRPGGGVDHRAACVHARGIDGERLAGQFAGVVAVVAREPQIGRARAAGLVDQPEGHLGGGMEGESTRPVPLVRELRLAVGGTREIHQEHHAEGAVRDCGPAGDRHLRLARQPHEGRLQRRFPPQPELGVEGRDGSCQVVGAGELEHLEVGARPATAIVAGAWRRADALARQGVEMGQVPGRARMPHAGDDSPVGPRGAHAGTQLLRRGGVCEVIRRHGPLDIGVHDLLGPRRGRVQPGDRVAPGEVVCIERRRRRGVGVIRLLPLGGLQHAGIDGQPGEQEEHHRRQRDDDQHGTRLAPRSTVGHAPLPTSYLRSPGRGKPLATPRTIMGGNNGSDGVKRAASATRNGWRRIIAACDRSGCRTASS